MSNDIGLLEIGAGLIFISLLLYSYGYEREHPEEAIVYYDEAVHTSFNCYQEIDLNNLHLYTERDYQPAPFLPKNWKCKTTVT